MKLSYRQFKTRSSSLDVDHDIHGRRIAFSANAIRKDYNAIVRGRNLTRIYKDIGVGPHNAIQFVKSLYNNEKGKRELNSNYNYYSTRREGAPLGNQNGRRKRIRV